ncbi:hypothetical protein TWF481_009165 [Arthrobotrys musiformis]|uniref:Uncharacterized protein n=1 Tax=Arthrobotrys musiformis TaxID=47236 RepID=A0AAV9W431_9PEZI
MQIVSVVAALAAVGGALAAPAPAPTAPAVLEDSIMARSASASFCKTDYVSDTNLGILGFAVDRKVVTNYASTATVTHTVDLDCKGCALNIKWQLREWAWGGKGKLMEPVKPTKTVEATVTTQTVYVCKTNPGPVLPPGGRHGKGPKGPKDGEKPKGPRPEGHKGGEKPKKDEKKEEEKKEEKTEEKKAE